MINSADLHGAHADTEKQMEDLEDHLDWAEKVLVTLPQIITPQVNVPGLREIELRVHALQRGLEERVSSERTIERYNTLAERFALLRVKFWMKVIRSSIRRGIFRNSHYKYDPYAEPAIRQLNHARKELGSFGKLNADSQDRIEDVIRQAKEQMQAE